MGYNNMIEVTTLTGYPNQIHKLLLENRETADFRLYFYARQYSWYYDITYKDITIKGSKVVLTPNSLRQFKNILPFGLAFYSDSFVEPFKLDDFVSGRIKMGILNKDEVQEIESEMYRR